MRTSDPDIFALGECVEVARSCLSASSRRSTTWRRVVAARLAGDATTSLLHPEATATKLKVTGIDLFSLGDFADGDDREEIVLRDAARGVYKRLVLKDDKLIGDRPLMATTADGAWFNDLKKSGVDICGHARDADLRPGVSGGRPAGPYGGRCSLAG